MMKSYKSSFVQWLGYLALTEETGVQFPYGENIFLRIEYYYYSKKLSNSKDGKKKDNKGIKLIKTFIKNMYYLYGKIKGKKDE